MRTSEWPDFLMERRGAAYPFRGRAVGREGAAQLSHDAIDKALIPGINFSDATNPSAPMALSDLKPLGLGAAVDICPAAVGRVSDLTMAIEVPT